VLGPLLRFRESFYMPKATFSAPATHPYSGANFGAFPLGVDPHYYVGVAKSEHSKLTNREIIFEDFQPL